MVESVYCSVWTDSLYKADYISSFKGYTENEWLVKNRKTEYVVSYQDYIQHTVEIITRAY